MIFENFINDPRLARERGRDERRDGLTIVTERTIDLSTLVENQPQGGQVAAGRRAQQSTSKQWRRQVTFFADELRDQCGITRAGRHG
jgi:hypothetical protein